ncbi:hypothetical protein EGW08_014378 [Elysia chlorotica]|uniref:ADF-H domain-containing protein n=1 Tax=Elysia chlorotica TaxID=188477 RepID=A0A433T8D9_ELYCH|nr:hypothetical protein EGW08_014378 [Elysia chlorotica]
MASGVKVVDDVKLAFSNVSINSSSKKKEKLKYGIFKFSEDATQIVVDSTGKKGESENWEYDKLVQNLPANDVRYVAYDFEFLKMDGTPNSKVILVSWCPETSPIKKKMLAASSFNSLKTALGNPDKYLEGDCLSEVDTKAVLDKLQAKEGCNS